MSEWLTWQLVDSAFPTGTFSHSLGLEAAWQHGEVRDHTELGAFLDSSILQTGCATLPLLNTSYHQPGRVAELDGLAEAFLVNQVANRASRVQGRTLLATACRIWPHDSLVRLREDAAGLRCHVAPLSGVLFRRLGVSLETAQRVTLFAAARGVLSAAVRLGIVGSFEAQRLQFECGPRLDAVLGRCDGLTADDLSQTAPLIDILQGGHDRLYSRLFQS